MSGFSVTSAYDLKSGRVLILHTRDDGVYAAVLDVPNLKPFSNQAALRDHLNSLGEELDDTPNGG